MKHPEPIDPLLCVKEVARILGLSRRLARELLHTNQIKHCQIGHRLRVRPEDLDKFIAQSQKKD